MPKKYYDMYKNLPLESFLKDPNIPAAGTEMGDFYRDNIKYYYANITGVDEQMGRIIQGLKDRNLMDNTIIIVTADHGNCLGKHEEISKNNIFEESLKIPFVIYWKGKIIPRVDDTFLGSMPDIFPTPVSYTHLDVYKRQPLPDFSWVGYHYGNDPLPIVKDYKIFDVTAFGAIPNDMLSDKAAIQAAIDAANKNGSGIVFFPKGKFLVNEQVDAATSIVSKGSRIIFRGSGSGPGGTELLMQENLPPKYPDQMWTVPPLFIFGLSLIHT